MMPPRWRLSHALIDIREPHQPFSAGDFRTEAAAAMARITAAGRIPLCGRHRPLPRPERGWAAAGGDPGLVRGWKTRRGAKAGPACARLAQVDPLAAARGPAGRPATICGRWCGS